MRNYLARIDELLANQRKKLIGDRDEKVLGKEIEKDEDERYGDMMGIALENENAVLTIGETGIDDLDFRTPDNKRYYKSYGYFVSTKKGRNFLKRFSNGVDSRWSFIKQNEKGDLNNHIFKIRRNNTEWAGSIVRLISGNNEGIDLLDISTSDIYPNMRFSFEVRIKETIADNIWVAHEIGHEVFLHIENKLSQIEYLLKIAPNTSKEVIANELNFIGFSSSYYSENENKIWLGITDHYKIISNTDYSLKLYLSELSNFLRSLNLLEEAEKVESEYQETLKQYLNGKNKERYAFYEKSGGNNINQRANFAKYLQDKRDGKKISFLSV